MAGWVCGFQIYIPPLQFQTHQFVILILHLKLGCNTVPGVKECSPLTLLRQIVNEDAHEVDRDEDDDVGDHSLPLCHQLQLRVQDDHADDGVTAGQQQAVGDGHPGPGSQNQDYNRDFCQKSGADDPGIPGLIRSPHSDQADVCSSDKLGVLIEK